MRKFTNVLSVLTVILLTSGLVLAQVNKPAKVYEPVSSFKGGKVFFQPEATKAALWTQMTTSGDGAIASQDFEAAYDTYDCRGADDFIVSGGPWDIRTVKFLGAYFNGVGPAAGFNVEFFYDAAGMPGASIAYYPSLSYFQVGGTTFYIPLPGPLSLPDGTYWVSIQARLDYAAGGQWGWETQSAPQINNERHWINPLDGFGNGAVNWTPGSVLWPAHTGFDLCFELHNVYLAPLVPNGTCQMFTNSFGAGEGWLFEMNLMTTGQYNWSLCTSDPCAGSYSVGADGDFYMYSDINMTTQLWYIDGINSCGYNASTYGTGQENWAPPADGYYYLWVADYVSGAGAFDLAYIDNALIPPANTCDHEVIMFDDFGDGWNGGYIDIYLNSVLTYGGVTLASGAGPLSYLFAAADGDIIDIVWTAGGWPEEASYEVYDGEGNLLGSDGVGGVPPVGLTGLIGNCPPPPCCDHSVVMFDDFGDGWNGGYIDIYLNGVLTYGGVTLATGFGPETYLFNACVGDIIDIVWTAGGWPEEASYEVYDGAGNLLGSDGVGGVPPVGLSGLIGNCGSGPAGCENTSMYPGAPVVVDATGLLTTITNCNYAGEYAQLTNIQVGNYEFTMQDLGTGTYITLTDGPPTGANILAYGPSPLQYTTTSTADLYIHFNLDASCGTDFACHITTAQLLPSGCENTTQYPSGTITVDPTGLLTTISGCNYAGEYAHVTGITLGETYEFTMEDLGSGTFITVTDGPPTGANFLASGVSPISWTATYTGDVYVHFSLNSNCDVDGSCHDTYVQCTSCGGVTPPNDDCVNAEAVVCNDVKTGSTATATFDGTPLCGTSNTAPGVWYVFTGIGETVIADLQGSLYDTKLTVYEGDCANLVCVWGNDDYYGLQSRVDWYSEAGVNYYILVHGYSSSTGDYTLNITCTPAAATTWTGGYGDNVFTNAINWTDGVPGTYTDASIPGGLGSYPTVGRVNVCNDIYIGSDAIATATLLDNGLLTVYGTATVDRYYGAPTWHLVSSPISNGLAGMYTGMYLQWYDEYANAWNDIIPVTDPLIPVLGYALWVDAPWTASYVGNLNTGTQGLPIMAAGPDPYHWNLFGNPYPSGLNWDLVWPANPQIAGAVYYLDAATGNYLSYNGGMGGGSQYVPPMQGFFVSGLADGAPFVLDNSMRTHAGGNLYYKSEFSNMIVLKAEGNGYTDKAYLRFDESATDNFDSQYDAYKLFSWSNDLLPQFYTTGGDKLSINVLPETETVPAGFKAGVSGTYTISIDEMEGISEVILEDLFTGTFTNLSEGAYTFNYNAGDVEARFVLHFGPLAVPEFANVGFNIFSSGKDVYVYVPENTKGNIVIYNALGQIVKTAAVNSPVNTIRLENTATYIVRVLSDEMVVTKKVYIE